MVTYRIARRGRIVYNLSAVFKNMFLEVSGNTSRYHDVVSLGYHYCRIGGVTIPLPYRYHTVISTVTMTTPPWGRSLYLREDGIDELLGCFFAAVTCFDHLENIDGGQVEALEDPDDQLFGIVIESEPVDVV